MSLEIENLYKKYPNSVVALDDLSISVEKGMFGLLGPNGAGKSSLMRTIATLQLADRGTIFFQDIDVFKDEQSLRKKLGYLPQDFGVYPKISAQNLLDHFAYLKGIISKKDRQKIIDYVLELTNLSAHADRPASAPHDGVGAPARLADGSHRSRLSRRVMGRVVARSAGWRAAPGLVD